MVCPHCENEIKDSAKFCPKCARGVSMSPQATPSTQTSRTCPTCGLKNPDDAKFCMADGTPLASSPETARAPDITGGEVCPQCKTKNKPGAKFCSADGFPLMASPSPDRSWAEVARTEVPKAQPTAPSAPSAHRSSAKWVIVLAVVLLGAAAGGYYFYTHQGTPQVGPPPKAQIMPAAPPGSQTDPSNTSLEGSQGSSTAGDIRGADFLNYTYPTILCNKEFRLGKVVKVRNGEFTKGSGGEQVYFGITDNKVSYHDLTNDGLEEAVVPVSCGAFGSNWAATEIFVFEMKMGKPALLGRIDDEVMERDYGKHYRTADHGLWRMTQSGVSASGHTILIERYADGSHAEPRFVVTFSYRWNGKSFSLAGTPIRRAR